jgi:glycosyltransferase involved in cell wall biosynthesis
MNGGRINKIETPIIKFALRSKPVIIYHSSCQKVLYETVYKNVVSYAEFIHFGVNIDEFRPLNLPVSNYILSFGYEKRDYPTLLKAWKATHHPGTKLCIIGDDSILETETIKVISKIDILELKQYIASSLFVIIPLPVFYYSYGQMSFLQSMAMGKPVIVTETPSSVDYLKDVTGALLVKPYDSFDLKYKIEYLLQNKEILAKMGDEARKYIASTLNEETMAKKIHNLIVKCTSKKLN